MKRLELLILIFSVSACHIFKNAKSKRTEEATLADAHTESAAVEAKEIVRPDNSTCLAWATVAEAPSALSKTGCFEAKDTRQPVTGLLPYFVRLSFWSDGADKRRWFALPNGMQVTWDAKGQAQFPVGSVLIKEFSWQGKRIETRLFLHHAQEGWVGYTYEWNEAETDAMLVAPEGKTIEVGALAWDFPTTKGCARCHSEAAGPPLGWDPIQINTELPQVGGMNQIAYFQKMGVIPANLPIDLAKLPRIKTGSDASDEEKARAYLHVNCAVCHRPGGQAIGDMDLRLSASFEALKVCDVVPLIDDLGLADARLIKPKNPEASVLLQRMMRSDYSRMPPLASHRVDEEGVTLIRAWINSIPDCNRP